MLPTATLVILSPHGLLSSAQHTISALLANGFSARSIGAGLIRVPLLLMVAAVRVSAIVSIRSSIAHSATSFAVDQKIKLRFHRSMLALARSPYIGLVVFQSMLCTGSNVRAVEAPTILFAVGYAQVALNVAINQSATAFCGHRHSAISG